MEGGGGGGRRVRAPSTLLLCLGGTLHLQAHGQLCDRSLPSEWRTKGRWREGEGGGFSSFKEKKERVGVHDSEQMSA